MNTDILSTDSREPSFVTFVAVNTFIVASNYRKLSDTVPIGYTTRGGDEEGQECHNYFGLVNALCGLRSVEATDLVFCRRASCCCRKSAT